MRVPAQTIPVAGRIPARLPFTKAERWPSWRDLRDLLGFELAFYVAYRIAMGFTQVSAAPLWFPDSVLLCALLLTRPRRWWWYVLGALPVRLLAAPANIPLWFLLTTFVIDSAKNVGLAFALRRTLGVPTRLTTVRLFAGYCLLAVIIRARGYGWSRRSHPARQRLLAQLATVVHRQCPDPPGGDAGAALSADFVPLAAPHPRGEAQGFVALSVCLC